MKTIKCKDCNKEFEVNWDYDDVFGEHCLNCHHERLFNKKKQ